MRTVSRLVAATAVAVLLFLLALVVTGCHLRPLLSGVSVSPSQISPDADGVDDVTNVRYTLSRNAVVSIFLEDASGQRYFFRRDRPRSSGTYEVQWGGVVNQPRWLEMEAGLGRELVQSWVLADGAYTWVISATDTAGRVERAEGTITLAHGDTVVPELRSFTVTLPTFSPNQDGLQDRTGVSYSLNKDVDSVQVYLYSPLTPTVQYPLEEQERAIKPGEAGYHFYDYDGGVDRGADPPADGLYIVEATARDLAGNQAVVSGTLTIREGGKPRADVVKGTILWGGVLRSREGTELYLSLGATLVFTTYVENYGKVPIRTSGPPSGTCYRSDQNFNTLAVEQLEDSWHEQPGAWRFGVNLDVSETDFPYRWVVGQRDELRCEVVNGQEQCFLDPGKRGTVIGCITMVGPFPRKEIFAWGGLIHQWVSISAENNYVDRVLLHIGEP